MADTSRHLYEIEVALAKYDRFNYIKNIVAFNVNGWGGKLPIWHECDMLILSKAGYLTEIEIKRSWTDFLADFKKRHSHESQGLIKYFFYAVPSSIVNKVIEYINNNNIACNGVYSYTEELYIREHGVNSSATRNYRKLTLEERLELARYGAMRSVMLKKKLIEYIKNNHG